MSIYSFQVKTIGGELKSLSDYKGKVLLIVNTASKCGFSKQFEGLEALYQEYNQDDFEILGFPCSQFLNQEYKTEANILEFCQLNYGVTFPMFSKVKVRGKDKIDLYDYLITQTNNKKIEWNFTKFLINRKGEVVNRFSPKVTPEMLKKEVAHLIK